MTQTAPRLSEQRAYLLKVKEHLEIPPLDDRPSFDDCTSGERQAVEVIEQAVRNNAGKTAIERMYERYGKKQLKRLLGDPTVKVAPDLGDVGFAYKPLPDGILPAIPAWKLPVRDAYIQYSKVLSPEGYEEFHEACFWFLASTIAAHRVYAEFVDDIYTPLYFAFVARSSLYAKSETIRVVKKVLYAIGLDFLMTPDRVTPQKLLSDMAGKFIDTSNFEKLDDEEQARVLTQIGFAGQRGFIMNELGKFVRGMLHHNGTYEDFNTLFLEFYDCPPRYSNATIARSVEPIHHPYLAICGAMTPSSFIDKAGDGLWKDGTWARFNFVCPPVGSDIDAPFKLGKIPVPSTITTSLRTWHNRLGEPEVIMVPLSSEDGTKVLGFEPHEIKSLPVTGLSLAEGEGGITYQTWVKYRSALKDIIRADQSEVFDSAYVRLATTVIRIAILAASIDNSAQIEIRHMVMAIEFCEKSRMSLHRLYTRIQAGDAAAPTLEDKILNVARDLREQGKINPTQRDFATFLHMNSVDLLPYLQALAKAGCFKQTPGRQAGSFRFELVEDGDDEE